MLLNSRCAVIVALLAVGVSSAGCAHKSVEPADPAKALLTTRANDGDAAVRFALRYWQELQAMPMDEILSEYQRVDATQRRHNEDMHARIQLALLRTLPKTPFHDLGGALALIDGSLDTLPDDAAEPVENFLWLLRGFVQAQKNAEQRANALARKSGELQGQLNQLKSIERSLENRTAPSVPAPAQGAP